MFVQLLIGAAIITVTIALQAVVIGLIESVFYRLKPWLMKPPRITKMVIVLIGVVLVIMVGVSINTWLWAAVFLAVDALETLEEAVYFATVSFTSLGFGDITLGEKWRLLSSLAAANGLIIFGLSTAFLMEFIFELRTAQKEQAEKHYIGMLRKKMIRKQIRKQLKKHLNKDQQD
ncbi:MAG TPA: two pore domain potassium channel family protein [Hellea balneolensis]|uniref:Two pore domain potassium channel family protein n=1 Tax=Hellea balneolensis TaxID=287478 RepID=A0A7C5LRD2_9PROT|nr:two pore domain potassium channel family protein [Hellea balneolensis]